ncbi:hypothetical protein F4803DRAFT_555275 [Xylaria telfairii]|nr:hypothetical protein F4803DRAFT_555275 [Xylaria telfairii]
MSTSKFRPLTPTVTIENAEKAGFFFLSVAKLQPGTTFIDVWKHLKQSVKRIEHVEVFPDTLEAWICVSKRINFDRAIDSFRAPLYVRATNKSKVVMTLDTNGDSPITIRNPEELSSYGSNVMKLATNNCKPSKPAVAYRRHEIVIAHGTYIPPNPKASPVGYQRRVYTTPELNPSTPSTPSTPGASGPLIGPYSHFFTRPIPPPSPPTTHTVSLSGFHPNTTLRQVQALVRHVSSRRELNDPRLQVIDGTTIVTSDKTDARRMRRALNGVRLQGVPITATRGRRPYEFGTYPPPNFNPYINPNATPYSWPYPYVGLQNLGHSWGQGFGHSYGHNYTQTYTQDHTQNYSRNYGQNRAQNSGQSAGCNYGQNHGPGWSYY